MSTRKTTLDRVIAALDAEIAMLQLAKSKLAQQQAPSAKRKPRAAKPVSAPA
jgi:hypothetical protein